MKKIVFTGIFLGVAVLGILFFVVSFRFIGSRSAVNSDVAASHQNSETSPAVIPQSVPALIVEGNDTFARAIRAEIKQMDKSDPSLGQVNLVSAPGEAAQSPLLVVTIKQRSGYWTPVYAQTDLQVETAFSTNGDVSFRDTEPTQFRSSGDQVVMQYEGHYQLTDTSWGVMSQPGYQEYLAHQVAVSVLSSLQDQIRP